MSARSSPNAHHAVMASATDCPAALSCQRSERLSQAACQSVSTPRTSSRRLPSASLYDATAVSRATAGSSMRLAAAVILSCSTLLSLNIGIGASPPTINSRPGCFVWRSHSASTTQGHFFHWLDHVDRNICTWTLSAGSLTGRGIVNRRLLMLRASIRYNLAPLKVGSHCTKCQSRAAAATVQKVDERVPLVLNVQTAALFWNAMSGISNQGTTTRRGRADIKRAHWRGLHFRS